MGYHRSNTKAKKCKGTGRANDFPGCGNPTVFRKFGLCKSCLRKWLFESEEGRIYFHETLISANRKAFQEDKKLARIKKEENKSIAQLIQEARIPFQKWIKMRDANLLCASCGKDSQIWDAGHLYKAELYSGLIFDVRNVHKQCRKCNTFLNGNEGEYRRRLVSRFGQEWMDDLDSAAIQLRQYKWTREELLEIKKEYLAKIKNEIK